MTSQLSSQARAGAATRTSTRNGRSIPLGAMAVASVLLAGDATAQQTDPRVRVVPHTAEAFGPDPVYSDTMYDYQAQLDIYGAKHLNPTQRPLLELGSDMYGAGPLRRGGTPLGGTNLLIPQLLLYGDLRAASGFNSVDDDEGGTVAARLNLDVDLKLTATERIHATFRPLENDGVLTRFDFAADTSTFDQNFSAIPVALFFEGDLGAIVGGLAGRAAPFDLPVAAGLMPLVFHNGTWLEDAFTGAAFTIPARNSAALDWSNYDISFFVGFDKVSHGASPAIGETGQLAGVNAFIEAYGGYVEAGYAYVGDDSEADQSYHSYAVSFSKRYGTFISNSLRYVGAVSAGSALAPGGHLLLLENSLITSRPSTVVPYLNLFAGFDRPVSAARDPGAGGVLRNTGLSFEPDAVTALPALTATAQDAVGGALGLNLLGSSFDRQLVVEVAGSYPLVESPGLPGEQVAFGVRAQRTLTNAIILRADGMYGHRKDLGTISGVRLELRHKF